MPSGELETEAHSPTAPASPPPISTTPPADSPKPWTPKAPPARRAPTATTRTATAPLWPPRSATAAAPEPPQTDRYGWLGGKERPTATAADAILMGVRLYDPGTGRFLQTDPVPGGSDNSYEYASQSPVSYADPAGTWKVSWGWTAVHFTLSRRQNTILYTGTGFAAALIGGMKKLGPYGRVAYFAFLGYAILAWVAELYGKCLRENVSYFAGYAYPSFAKCARR
ncbi:RHS repeat-associated core domain-containing protein [Streptomyces sp. NPDC010273]|uniref:RHS repeat-associated core domain-containing protein n=1 Tax=Streptomyces sp. NPDC010273 TaxID=3364829 RepID=UPI0036E45175